MWPGDKKGRAEDRSDERGPNHRQTWPMTPASPGRTSRFALLEALRSAAWLTAARARADAWIFLGLSVAVAIG